MKSIVGFPPIVNKKAKVLILGSMPSEVSLQKQQYYGHDRNAFWPIMMELFSGQPDADYQQRQQLLLAQQTAVWDVLQSCHRQGSLDANIKMASVKVNDFQTFFIKHSALRNVFFNGGMAEKVYKKYVLPGLGTDFAYLHYHRLPSTSPAYASMTLAEKANAWRMILRYKNAD